MARTLTISGGNTISVPEEGEVFRTEDTGQIYKIQNGNLGTLPIANAQRLGININALPQYRGEILQYGRDRGIIGTGDARTSEQDYIPKPFTSTGEQFSIVPHPDNPNQGMTVSNQRGIIQGGVAPQPQGLPSGKTGADGSPVLTAPDFKTTSALSPLPTPGVGTMTDMRNSIGAGIQEANKTLSLLKDRYAVAGEAGTQTQQFQPGTAQPVVKAAQDVITNMQVAADVAASLKNAQDALSADKATLNSWMTARGSASALLADEFKKRGLETKNTALSDLNERILARQQLLRKIPEDLKNSLAQVGVTQAQYDRLLLQETKQPTEDLRDLLEQRGVLQSDIDRAMNFAESFTNMQLKDQATQLSAMELGYKYDKELFDKLSETQQKIVQNSIDERKQILQIAEKVPDLETRKKVLASGSPEQALQQAGDQIIGTNSDIQEYNLAKSQGFKGSFIDFKKAESPKNETGQESLNTLHWLQINALQGNINVPPTLDNAALISALNQVTAKSPTNTKISYQQQLTKLLNQNNTEAAKQLVKTATIQNVPVEEQRQVIGREQAIVALDRISGLLDQWQTKGGSTNIFRGTAETIAQKLGATTDPNLANIANQMQIALFDYRRAMTGVQFSYAEGKQYQNLFSSIASLDDLNKAKIDSLKQSMLGNQETFYRVMMGSANYDAIFGSGLNKNTQGITPKGLKYTILP